MKTILTIGLVIIIAFAVGLILGWPDGDKETNMDKIEEADNKIVLENGLIIEDVLLGSGPEAKAGDEISVHYTGTFEDGTIFDSSVPRGEAFSFSLGAGQVIAGWDQGVEGMKVGGKRNLSIPPALAYGELGRPGIPPNSTLNFEVELLGIGGK